MKTCGQKKCGEYNMLVCVAAPHAVASYPNNGHCYVVDHENDYPWNKPKPMTKALKREMGKITKQSIQDASVKRVMKNLKAFHLPIAILPNKRVACCCTPTTCTCKKPVDKRPGSGKVVSK